jgi:alanine racemase
MPDDLEYALHANHAAFDLADELRRDPAIRVYAGCAASHCPAMTKQGFAAAGCDVASLTVRLDAIAQNYRIVGRLAGRAVVGAVVKADSYGLGMGKIAPMLAASGCETFFVARLEEGVALRHLTPRARIFVLDGASCDAASALVAHELTPVLNSLAEIAAWAAAAKKARRRLDAALHFDTGMNRLGMPADELAIVGAQWKKRLAGVNLVLLMSHLACADAPKAAMNAVQLSRFRAGLAMLPPATASLAASCGMLLGRPYQFDMVRPGLALYGGNPRPGQKNPVKTAAFLNGRVLQTRRIDKGESVGYGATFRAKRPTMLATVALGYADGLTRAMSSKGVAFAGGRAVPVVGRVSMDLVGLDVTDARRIKSGDRVEFLGAHIRLEDLAKSAGTNAHEVLTGLASRTPRRYAGETE